MAYGSRIGRRQLADFATHQSVVRVMEAARAAGYAQITFTTQAQAGK